MKFWKEKELNPVEKMNFWKGEYINKLEENEVFVFGANPQARHFAGVAKVALGFGAVPIDRRKGKPGIARGLSPNNKTYALITKSLEAGYTEPETGITYHKEGFQSVSPEQIRFNIKELYETAKRPENLNKKFLITYKYESWPNGSPKKSLNGYTAQEMLEMFAKDIDVPVNIIFHESYKPHLDKLYKNRQHNKEFSVYEDGKTIDIKEEDIIWIKDEDERNPEFRNGFGAAKVARDFGAKPYGGGRGIVGNTFGLITKNLVPGFVEKATGIVYEKAGEKSVSKEMISENIDELYQCALNNPEKKFFIAYKSEGRNLNGYTPKEMWDLFTENKSVPENIRFHESFRSFLSLNNVSEQKKKEVENLKKSYEEAKENGKLKTNEIFSYEREILKDNQPRENFTFFWHSPSPFSQWHPSLFELKGITFTSGEQFMMFCKAKLFKDEEIAKKILNLNNKENSILKRFLNKEITSDDILKNTHYKNEWDSYQKEIKQLGRQVKDYDDELWVKHRESYVGRGNYEKFSQNDDLKQKLLNTGNTIMAESNYFDKIWAIGIKESDPNATSPSKWKGLNLLGKILTNIREKFKLELKLKNDLDATEKKENFSQKKQQRKMKIKNGF